jgi:hypothetical protein
VRENCHQKPLDASNATLVLDERSAHAEDAAEEAGFEHDVVSRDAWPDPG